MEVFLKSNPEHPQPEALGLVEMHTCNTLLGHPLDPHVEKKHQSPHDVLYPNRILHIYLDPDAVRCLTLVLTVKDLTFGGFRDRKRAAFGSARSVHFSQAEAEAGERG